MTLRYYEDRSPGYGALPARAYLESDAPRTDLAGDWRFHLSEAVDLAPYGFWMEDYDDSGWTTLPVPSSWPMHGNGSPAYTNVGYPFPLDPPRVPDENPTGDHRLVIELGVSRQPSPGRVRRVRTPADRPQRARRSGTSVVVR